MVQPYTHEPLTDFTRKEERLAYLEALKKIAYSFGRDYPLIIGGSRFFTKDKILSVNPANKQEVIGLMSKTDFNMAEKAVQTAVETFQTWRKTKADMRADILFKAAAILRRRKHEFSALMTKEAGKPWKEADADTAEAIDFLEYYGRQMLLLEEGAPVGAGPVNAINTVIFL